MLEVKRIADRSLPASSKTARARDSANQRASNAVEHNRGEALAHNQPHLVGPALARNKTRIPVITGEAHFRGVMSVNGVLAGHLRNNASSLEVRQKALSELRSEPELSGELSFTDLVRVNGHIAGTVYSKSGTLIVDSGAAVDAMVNVSVAIIRGTVNGDIVAQKRVEIAAGAKVFGNIWTRSLAVDAGATFDGDCNMLQEG